MKTLPSPPWIYSPCRLLLLSAFFVDALRLTLTFFFLPKLRSSQYARTPVQASRSAILNRWRSPLLRVISIDGIAKQLRAFVYAGCNGCNTLAEARTCRETFASRELILRDLILHPAYPAARAFPPSPALSNHACFRALGELLQTLVEVAGDSRISTGINCAFLCTFVHQV